MLAWRGRTVSTLLGRLMCTRDRLTQADSYPTAPTTASNNVSVSVVIPVYNGGEKFRHCLYSVAQAIPAPAEVIVVADGDTDGSAQVAEEFGSQVIRVPNRGGPA